MTNEPIVQAELVDGPDADRASRRGWRMLGWLAAIAGVAIVIIATVGGVAVVVRGRMAAKTGLADLTQGAEEGQAAPGLRSYVAPPPVVPIETLDSQPLSISPKEVNTTVLEKSTRRDGINFVTLTLDVRQLAEGYPWSDDGGKLFLLQKEGALLEICLPEWKVRRQLSVPGQFSHLARCKAGLVLARRSTGDLILVDMQTMKAKKCVKMGGVDHIAASPALPLVFSPSVRKLRVVDIEAGALMAKTATDDHLSCPEVTPDGKYFFCTGTNHSALRRYTVRGGALSLEQSLATKGTNSSHVDVSADSKYVTISFGGGAAPPAGYPQIPYATYVYAVKDLHTPAMALYPGAYPRTVAVDPVTGRFYAQNRDYQLIVFSAQGDLEDAYAILGRGDTALSVGETERLIAHPRGNKVLVITAKKVCFVELPLKPTRRGDTRTRALQDGAP